MEGCLSVGGGRGSFFSGSTPHGEGISYDGGQLVIKKIIGWGGGNSL